MKLKLKSVYFGYQNFKMKDINLEFESGEIVAVTGNNGGGKTTLLGIVSGINKPAKGKIFIDDVEISKSNKKIGIVFQNPDSQIIFNNVYDDMCFTLKNFKIPKDEWENRIVESLKAVGMENFKNSEIFTMSSGQKQRVVIANMLAINPDIMVFDEASSFLDTAFKEKFYELLKTLKNQGKIVIFATNALEEIAYSDRVIFVSGGNIEFDKKTVDVIDHCELFEQNGIYVPLKLKLMQKLKIYSGSDSEIIKSVERKK